MDVFAWLERFIIRRKEEKMLHDFGDIHQCPWCKQIAQSKPGWSFKRWDRDPQLDVLQCGNCGGTSLWWFTIGMTYVGPLAPPERPKEAHFYDVAAAKFRDEIEEAG